MRKPSFIADGVEEGEYFFLDLEPAARTPLAVACGGRERCGRQYRIDRASFRYSAIEYVEAGEGTLMLDGKRFVLQPGAVFAYGPGVPHRLQTIGNKRLVKHFVDFSGSEAVGLLRRSGLSEPQPRTLTQTRWVQNLFEQMMASGRGRPAFAHTHCALLLRLLLSRLEEDLSPPRAAASAAFETFCRCKQFLADHHLELATIAEAAAACRVDPAYMARLFKKYAGEGAHAFLTRQKVQHSAELLVNRGLSVKAAGEAVGFDDPYHYSRVFKRVYGVAPRYFVQRVRRNEANPHVSNAET